MEAGRPAGGLWGVRSRCTRELVPPNEEGPGAVLASLLLPGKQFQGQSRASEGRLSVRTGDVGPAPFTPRLSWDSLRWALEEGPAGLAQGVPGLYPRILRKFPLLLLLLET